MHIPGLHHEHHHNSSEQQVPETVIITGGSGYIGQHIIGELLKQGYKVVAIVRSQIDGTNLIESFDSPLLSIDVVDQLEKPNSIDFVLKQHKEATVFIATAAVVKFDAQDQKKEVMDPSLAIIENTLTSIKHHGEQIKRVILTSSSSAMVGPDKVYSYNAEYSDNDWSPLDIEQGKTSGVMAYFTSKKLNEKFAWNFIKQEEPHFDLVSLNPALCLGPTFFANKISIDRLPASNMFISSLLKLQKDSPVPEFASGAIDVRDVAKAHVSVIKNPKASNQRILLEAYKATNPNIIHYIRENFPQYKDKLPDSDPIPESAFKMPNDKKSREILGIENYEYTLEQSVVDLVKQTIE
ncbi:hypothetical protein KGF56_002112 [Candida oxycetoniae]|uniref:NAD-dependent epimerase/dehydratase domain-containing protein n=1 Tax=Candida oxycetoniae TaxID=497107 RepID=A0AAI9SZE5_9ASCO|nr:uncharacterized protein KGF56_002112 [Candida oxycetoniae]KAI3405156.2 hypothetical protein KGF56_002112 [Candida oxycetoniae]